MNTTDTGRQSSSPAMSERKTLRAVQVESDEPAPRRRRWRRSTGQLGVTVVIVGAVMGLASPAQASYASRWADVDYNGTWDYIWDWDGDGDPDAVHVDLDGDSDWDFGLGDASEDGVIDLIDTDSDVRFEYSDHDQNGQVDQLSSQGLSLVIDMGCGAGHCVSPDMGMVGLALPHDRDTF